MEAYKCPNEPMEAHKGLIIYFDRCGLQPVGPHFCSYSEYPQKKSLFQRPLESKRQKKHLDVKQDFCSFHQGQ